MGTGILLRQLCFNVGILFDVFLLSVHAMIQTSEEAEGNGSLAVIGKNEVSLGNACQATSMGERCLGTCIEVLANLGTYLSPL